MFHSAGHAECGIPGTVQEGGACDVSRWRCTLLWMHTQCGWGSGESLQGSALLKPCLASAPWCTGRTTAVQKQLESTCLPFALKYERVEN